MIRNKVILFYPSPDEIKDGYSHPYFPISLLKIGSELLNEGYDVKIIDERINDNFFEEIQKDIINILCFGVTAMTGQQIKGGLNFSEFVKSLDKNIPVVWGGWHPTLEPESTVENKYIDIVVRGQGERTMADLLNKGIVNKRFSEVDGITYKKNDKIMHSMNRKFEDVNNFCDIDMNLVDIEEYIYTTTIGTRCISWVTSQGCPYGCGFCSTPTVFKRRWNGLSPERMIEQVDQLVKLYQIDCVEFVDDNFFVNNRRIEDFCNGLINNGIKINWTSDVRIDQIMRFSDSFIDLLTRSGCQLLLIGAESGDQEVLDLIDKDIKVDQTLKAANLLTRNNIDALFFIIIGFPLNPIKDLDETLKLIKSIKRSSPNHRFGHFLYTPYPGTPLWSKFGKNHKLPKRLEGWIDSSLNKIQTPWVDDDYLDKANMFINYFYYYAYPSDIVISRFSKGLKGKIIYFVHKIAKIRVKYDFYYFPIDWLLFKMWTTDRKVNYVGKIQSIFMPFKKIYKMMKQ